MKREELKKYRKILILGYGKEGKATEQYIRKNLPEVEIGIADQVDGSDYLKKQHEYDLVIKTPGIPRRLVTVPYTTATNIFFANKGNQPVIGVTGSKGKSTTASLIYHILKYANKEVRLVGNIGKPALEELEHSKNIDCIYVYELSSYQLEDIAYSPHISVVVSLFPEHMNYHGDEQSYYQAKQNMLAHATPEDYYIYNSAFPTLKVWADSTLAHSIPFENDFTPSNIPLLGEHNKSNTRGAITVSRLFQIPDAIAEKAVQCFEPLPHRLQNIGTYKDIIFYDDAISTTPESTIAALDSLDNVDTIFLGGEDRGYSFTALARKLKEKSIQNIVLFPQSGTQILEEIKKIFSELPRVLETKSMKEAVAFAYTHSAKGSICLLSTASPSYSLWKNFEEKGTEYQLFVLQYANE